jgi:hypothetical protein
MKALVADIFRLADLTEVKLVPELDVKQEEVSEGLSF